MRSATNNPTTGSNQSRPGSSAAWTSPGNILSSNNAYATASLVSSIGVRDDLVYLVIFYDIDFGIYSFAPTNNALPGQYSTAGDAYANYGSESEKWGTTLTPTLVNNSEGFGLALSSKDSDASPDFTDYLIAAGFGFSVPSYADVTGVSGRIERKSAFNSRTGTYTISVDHMELTVYYSVFYPKTRMYFLLGLLAKIAMGIMPLGILSAFGIIGVKSLKEGLMVQRVQTRRPKKLSFA